MLEIPVLLLIVLISSLILNHIILTNKLIKIPTQIPVIILVVLSFPVLELNNRWSIIISLFFIILIYGGIVNLSENSNVKSRVFNIGLFTGIMICLDSNFIFYYSILLISLIYYNQFNWRNFIIQLMGCGYMLVVLYFLFFLKYIDMPLNHLKPILKLNYSLLFEYLPLLCVIIVLLFLSLKELYINYYRKTEKSKKAFNILLLITFFSLLDLCLLHNLFFISFLIMTLSIVITNYLIYIKTVRFRTFLLGLLIVSFILRFF